MTTCDIKNMQITIETNDGQILVGTAADPIIIGMIAQFVKFVKADKSKFVSVPIKDIIQ